MTSLPSWNSVYQLGEALRRILNASGEPGDAPRYVLKRARNPRWKGPWYPGSRYWHQDLVLVLEQIRLIVKTNAPLSPALGASAQDYIDVHKGWSSERITQFLKVLGLAFLILLASLSALGDLIEEGTEALPELVQPIVLSMFLLYIAGRDRYKKPTILAALKNHIESGQTLSEAMERLSRFFPKDLVVMVGVGERTGKLERVIEQAVDDTMGSWTAQRDLKRILWYFAIGITIQFSIISFLMVKVIPVFYDLFKELGLQDATRSMPAPGMFIPLPPMNFILAFMDFLVYKGSVILGVVSWAFAVWFIFRRNTQRRDWASRKLSLLLLGMPGLRGMVVRQNLGSAARMLYLMLEAGIPLEQSLNAVAHGDLHRLYRQWFARVRKRVLNGDTLHEACSGMHVLVPIPKSFVALVGMGESHGQLENSFAYIAENYHAYVERRKRLLLGLLLPLGVFFMGYITLSFEASMFHMLAMLADSIVP